MRILVIDDDTELYQPEVEPDSSATESRKKRVFFMKLSTLSNDDPWLFHN